MPTVHFRNAKIFVGGYDISGDSSSVAVAYSAEMLDETAFGDTTRIHKGGLLDMQASIGGFWDALAGHVDAILWGIVGTDDQIVTVFANGITEGTSTDKGFSCKGVLESYNLSGDVGALLAFDASIQARGIEA